MSTRSPIAVIGLLLSILATPAWSQQEPANPAPQTVIIRERNPELLGKFNIDTSIPDTPGFAIIGASPATIIDPSAEPVTFATLSPFLDEDNNLKTGFAVGGSPYWWFNSGKTIEAYQDPQQTGAFERILARTAISAAFVDGGEDGADRAGFGLTTDLLSGSDYRLDGNLQSCVRTAYDPLSKAQRPDSEARADFVAMAEQQLKTENPNVEPGAVAINTRATALIQAWRQGLDLEALGQKFAAGVKKCQDDAAKRYLRNPSWTVAAAVAVDVDDSDILEGEGNGGAIWTAYRMPFGGNVNDPAEKQAPFITFFAKYLFDRTGTINATEVESNAATVGLAGGVESSNLKVSAQLGYQRVDYDTNPLNLEDDSYSVYSLSISRKIQDGIWINLDIGSSGEREAVANERADYLKLTLSYKVN